MGILLIVLVLFALTGIVAAIWGFTRPSGDGARERDHRRDEPPGKEGP